MAISVADFKNRFIRIFGNKVWEDFRKYRRGKSFNSMEDVSAHLIKYKNRYKDLSNFYSHKQYTRFILICIEIAYGDRKMNIDFDKRTPLSKGNYDRKWEIEHIFSQNSFDDTFKPLKDGDITRLPNCSNRRSTWQSNNWKIRYPSIQSNIRTNRRICLRLYIDIDKHLSCQNINNLTLISRKLNGDEEYKKANFQQKKSLMASSTKNELNFHINRIFKDKKAYKTEDYFFLLLDRGIKLKCDFERIFEPDNSKILIFFRDVLGYSESDIKSTFYIAHLIRKWCRKRRRIK